MLTLRLLRDVRQARPLAGPRRRWARCCGSGNRSLKSHLRENQLGHSQPTRPGAADPLFEIELDLAAKGSRESSRNLYGQLKAAILDRRLTAGAKLPPTRKSDAYFGISRNTAIEVYERLLNEGYVVTRHGSGTYVADRVPGSLSRHSPNGADFPHHRLNEFWLRPDVAAAMSFCGDRAERAPPPRHIPQVDFRPALV